ncbi:MAG: T9SS type A sorting domain-containing protein [Cytophagaceae bacterium]|jgi:hypothetical protein|nr:T9SS type A sorting domain-containing protein [Cytophagaceae bacterium]
MKKLYFTLSIACMAIMNTVAQIGIYKGNVIVKEEQWINLNDTVENVSVELKASATDDYYILAMGNLDLDIDIDFPVIEKDSIVITPDGDGLKLSKVKPFVFIIPELTIPEDAPLGGGMTFTDVPLTITLENGSIVDDVLTCEIKANITVMVVIIPVSIDVLISFEGALDIQDNINMTKTETMNIYPTLVEAKINVSNVNNAKYVIFGINGMVAKQGVTSGLIDVADLSKGIYILSVNGKTAKFAKK